MIEQYNIFIERLNKIGIKVLLAVNYPWVYIVKINGKKVVEKYCAKHGFTIAFMPKENGQKLQFVNLKEIFNLLRKYC